MLSKKVAYSKDLLFKAMKEHNKIAVACSFGKDSITVLHMVKEVADVLHIPFHVLFNNTNIEYRECIELRDKLTKEWELDVIETKPANNYFDIVDQYGWPIHPRGFGSSEKQEAVSKCCYLMKKMPTKKVIEEYQWDLYITGLTADESFNRTVSAKRYGDYFYSKSWKHTKCHAIMWFSEDDVYEYHDAKDIPLAGIYNNKLEGYKVRNGCMFCPQGWYYGKGKWLRTYYPGIFNTMMKKGLGDELVKAKLAINGEQSLFGTISAEEILQIWPCFFDKM